MWQCLEEGRANNGVDNLQVQRHTQLVPKLYDAGVGCWQAPKPHLGRSKAKGELLKLLPLTPPRTELSSVPRGW